MKNGLLLLPEQAHPLDELITMVRFTQQELENPRITEYLGRGFIAADLSEYHHDLFEQWLYPLMDMCSPHRIDIEVNKHYVFISFA